MNILYIDCPEPEKKDAFKVDKELSENEYVKMLRDYSVTIGTGMPKNNHYSNKYDSYENHKEDKINYSKALVNLYDISGKPCDIKELYKIQKNGMGVLIIDVIESDMEESFESEFKFWKRDSMNINNDKDIDKDERIRFLPIKNLQLEIDKHLFLLSGCKIYCEYDRMKVALIIQNVKEI